MPLHQLRIYEIDPASESHSTTGSATTPRGSWTRTGSTSWPCGRRRRDERLEFVYLLEWSDRDTLEHSWAAFMADESWAEVKATVRAAVGGEPVVGVSDRILETVAYPPYRLAR